MKTKLSPFVYKIKGKKNYIFFDSIRKKLFHISPEGNPKEMEATLLDNELVIKTDGVVPLKFTVNTQAYKTNVLLRQLQLKINGECDISCEECGNIGSCCRDNKNMTIKTLKNIVKQFKHIIIQSILIIGGNPLLCFDLIKRIRSEIDSAEYKIFLKDSQINEDDVKKLKDMGYKITQAVCENLCISEDDMEVDIFMYFYNQQFNPCWGNKIAINSQGDIKPCLWSDIIIGNISRDNVKDLIFTGKFDLYWELSKNKFKVCNECEFRFLCPDCRVVTLKETGSIYAKTSYCKYNPENGNWG